MTGRPAIVGAVVAGLPGTGGFSHDRHAGDRGSGRNTRVRNLGGQPMTAGPVTAGCYRDRVAGNQDGSLMTGRPITAGSIATRLSASREVCS
jgi:hypothetical protein